MRRLNSKLFLCLCGVLVVLVGAVFAIHWLQTGSIARALLARADRAEKNNQPEQAARYLSRYLELEPDDNEQRARLGRSLADMASTPRARLRAILVLEQVLLKEPDRHDLRRKLVRLALDVDKPEQAREHLDILQQRQKDNAEDEHLLGLLAEAQKKPDEAGAWYAKAITHAPQQIESYVRRADVLRQMADKERTKEKAEKARTEADTVMSNLLVANGEDPKARLARWQYYKRWWGLEKAAKGGPSGDVREALKLAPDDADVLLAAAELEQSEEHPEQARAYLEKGRKRYPQDARAYRELALLELRQGTRPENTDAARARALTCLRDGCKTITGAARADLLWTLGNILLDGTAPDELDEARRVITQISRSNGAPASVDYLNARVFIRQGRWSEAARLLANTRPYLNSSPELARLADLFLAQCYGQLNDPAAQVSSYEQVLKQDQNSLTARLGLAGLLAAQGQIDPALEHYRKAAPLPDAPASCWVEIARLTLMKNAAGRGTAEALKEIDDSIKKAEEENNKESVKAAERARNAGALTLLRAEVLVGRGKAAEADQLLLAATQKQPEQVELWAARAMLTLDPEGPKNAAKGKQILDEAEKTLADKPELRLPLQVARVRFWLAYGGPEALPAIKAMEPTEKATPDVQAGLLGELAEAYYRLGEARDAARLWDRLASQDANRNNLALRLLLFDVALQISDDNGIKERVDAVKRIEGQDGVLWHYAAAARLIAGAAKNRNKDGLDEANDLLNFVANKRPNWPTEQVARGNLEELKGNRAQAIACYRKALDNGERSTRVVFQLVDLLLKEQRTNEANAEITRVFQRPLSPADTQSFNRLSVDASLRAQDFDRVRQKLEAWKLKPNDWRDYLLRGQAYAASGGRDKEAEQDLRKAVELAGDAPEPRLALVQFLARKDKPGAAKAIDDIPANVTTNRNLLLGQSYEALGQTDKARTSYEAALSANPKDPVVLRSVAGFYLRINQLKQAEDLLRTLMTLSGSGTDAAWARRTLATAIASRAEFRRYPEALALVGLRLDATGHVEAAAEAVNSDYAEEHRAQAQVLAAQPLPEPRKKAIALLDDLNRQQQLTPDEQFLLGQLYEAGGQWDKGRAAFNSVPNLRTDPLYLAQYALALLRHSEWDEARRSIDQLAQLEKARQVAPGDFGSAELNAQLLEKRGQGAEAIQVLTKYVDAATTKPDKVFVLIGCLARQQKYTEALDRCTKARANNPPDVVGGHTVAVLRLAGADKARGAETEAWLKTACDNAANDTSDRKPRLAWLYVHRAALRDMQGDLAGAEEMCRKAREQDGANLVALNNLAWLLAQNGKAGEGLDVINQAIERAGPRAELLDTRATIHLALKRGDLAIADIEAANSDSPTPTRYFHLAQAHSLTNNTKEAVVQLQKANKSGLKKEQLHPVERAAYDKLVTDLKLR